MFRRGSMGREIAAAFAVLAIYLLTLLLPLHQAAGLQHDLAGLGHAPLDSWSICTPPAPDGHGHTPVVKCPAAGIGKTEFAGIVPASIDIEPPTVFAAVVYGPAFAAPPLPIRTQSGQPRAPPATV